MKRAPAQASPASGSAGLMAPTWGRLLVRNMHFYWRVHLTVVLGTAIAGAALTGALLLGDSVRGSLRAEALRRVGPAVWALAAREESFSTTLAANFTNLPSPGEAALSGAALLQLPGVASQASGTARANRIQIIGADTVFWDWAGPAKGRTSGDEVRLNPALAAQLNASPGDDLILRIGKPGLLSADAAISQKSDRSTAWRVKVAGIVSPDNGGDLNIGGSGVQAFNAFVDLGRLQELTGLQGKVNLLLLGPRAKQEIAPPTDSPNLGELLQTCLKSAWKLEDAGLRVESAAQSGYLEIRSPRVFIPPAVVEAAMKIGGGKGEAILTYLANLVTHGTNYAPYSMVTAAGPPFTPEGMSNDEIILSRWLADDLQAGPGDEVELVYFLPESGNSLRETTNRFRVRAAVEHTGIYADRSLMPDFPGLENAESTQDWDAGFPLTYKIRPKDETYWRQFRGTPKAFVTLGAGHKLWANRFGNVTAFRVPQTPDFAERLLAALSPDQFGLRFEPVRAEALRAASQGQDFGQLFLALSFFVVVAALLLTRLLFQFGLEQRVPEAGTLLALGFTSKQVGRLYLLEAGALAVAGGVLGAAGGALYAAGLLWALRTVWRSAAGVSTLTFYPGATSVAVGIVATAAVATATIWLALRKQVRRPAWTLISGAIEEMLPGSSARGRRAGWLGLVLAAASIGILGFGFTRTQTSPATFFGAGALLLVAAGCFAQAWLGAHISTTAAPALTRFELAIRGCARRPKRSLVTILLLASGCFLIGSISSFRLEATGENAQPGTGTGGFSLYGESSLPILRDLDTEAGREFYGLDRDTLRHVRVVGFRVRPGDEASCLNLNRARQPRLLGVTPGLLERRFHFLRKAAGVTGSQWDLLKANLGPDEVPAIGDANSIQWAMGKQIGDAILYHDGEGRPFKVRLVGALANSILQGSLVIDEAQFVKRFPNESGHRVFLIDAPPAAARNVAEALTRALQDAGFEATPAVDRLNRFNAVQNTYLATFQVLGGIGLLLGSVGLGVVVLRNVLERRGELAVLLAVGFQPRVLQRNVLAEHVCLLVAGLLAGLVPAALAVVPQVKLSGTEVPFGWLGLLLLAVLVNGMVWTWLATRVAMRGRLLEALRNE